MTTPETHRLIRKLFTLLILICCLTVLVNSPGADASRGKATRQICCSLCNGEPTDPGACRYGCNPDC